MHRHCHNQIHVNSNCKLIIHAHSYCFTSGHVFQLQTIKFLRARSSKCGSREIQEKTPSACDNIGATSHFQAQRGSDRSVPQEAPGYISQQCLIQPHRQHPQPGRMSSGPRSVSSDYRTQAPIETVLVGTVTAAKCKMEMAQERMAPAAPSERLRSQNIPPGHTVHGSSHPPPAHHSRILGC